MEATATGEINSYFNSYEKCNTTTDGSVFYLYKNQILTDYKSNYRQNAAVRGGAVFCDNCKAYFNTSVFYYNAAKQASIVFLKSTAAPGVDVTFYNTTMSDGYAADKGGAVSTEGSTQGIIRFIECSII